MVDPEVTARQGVTRPGLTPRILRSWVAPGRVVREMRAISDSGLLAMLMGAMVVFWVSQLPGHAREVQLDPSIPLNGRIAGALLAVIFMMPLLCYLMAWVVSVLVSLTRWRLSAHDSRLALFWALLAVSPAMLLQGLVTGLIGPGAALQACQVLTGIGFLFIWGAGLRVLAEPK